METDVKSAGYRHFLEQQQARIEQIRVHMDHLYPDPAGLVLEIGCGHGHYLTAYAQQHPQSHCMGIDLATKRIQKANAKREKRHLDRLNFLKADVREFMAAWPGRLSLERVFILFPDPWPKKRHANNRVLQASLLDQLARHSRSGTALHFRTDDEKCFNWGMDQVASHPAWIISDDEPWPFENPSFFQDLYSDYSSLTALFVGG